MAKLVIGMSLTQEWMQETLLNYGFKKHEAEVYIFLVLKGPKCVKDIAVGLGSYKRKVYRTLNKLGNIGLIDLSSNVPAHFSAVPFDRVLDALKDLSLREATNIEAKKAKIISFWEASLKENKQRDAEA